jgi:hypothetical protein
VSCAPGAFLGGSQGGQVCPPWLRAAFAVGVVYPVLGIRVLVSTLKNLFFRNGKFLLFLVDFAIFSGLLKIISVLGIRVLVSMEYLKTLYILYSEW